MKKIISFLAITAIIAATLFAFAACNFDDGTHKHSLVKVDKIPPTCDLAGVEEYYYCTCGLKFADADGSKEITAPGIIQPLGHSFSNEWTIDENGHYYECVCGLKSEEGAHADAEPNRDHHCDVCGYEMSKCFDGGDADLNCDICGSDKLHQCEFGAEWIKDETRHWHACVCGERADEALHEDSDNNHNCDACDYKMSDCFDSQDDADHDCDICDKQMGECKFGTEWINDETKHWHVCDCGAKSDEAIHEDSGNDHNCDACGYKMGECEFGAEWINNETAHWHACICGAKSDEAAHRDLNAKDHHCDVCGYEMSECIDSSDTDHKCDYCEKDGVTECVFGDAWISNETMHWHVCACGAKSGEAAHRPNRDAATEEDPILCLDCGYTIAPELEHIHKYTVTAYDEENHWLKCSGCGKIDTDSVKEHELSDSIVESTCTIKGTKTSTCECGFSKEEKLSLADHTAGEPVAEKVVNATCKISGSYQEVVYCSVCNFEISRTDKTINVIPHTEETVHGKAATCIETGLTDGVVCSACGDTLVEQKVTPIVDHTSAEAVRENEIPATCIAEGSYDAVVYCSVCRIELDRTEHTIAVVDHFYGEILEGPDGFYKECNTVGCGHVVSVAAPIQESYKASLNNSFVSAKKNSHVFVYSDHGAYGIKTNGQHWVETSQGSPESGAIGGMDKQGRYVEYTFTLDKPGTVDLIWSIAGNRYKLENGVAVNKGIPNLGGIGKATIDGRSVNLNGIELPAGNGTAMGTSVWWNLQQVVIPGVALDAGVHTFRFEITYIEFYGINIGSMTVRSDKEVGVQSASVKSVTLEQENGQIYYTMTMTLGRFVKQGDIKFWNEINGKLIYFNFESFVTDENGLTTARINMTNHATAHDPIAPHMSICGQNYVNGSNKNGDLINVGNNKITFTKTLIQANGKSYLLHNYWSMPSLLIVSQNYIRLNSVDLYKDTSANKVYYTITYRIIGYDPSKVQIFDGNTTYATTYTVDDAYNVTYKIDATNLAAIWPHLRLNGTNWDGMNNVKSDNGDVLFTVSEKNVSHNGKTYSLGTEWDMPRMIVK